MVTWILLLKIKHVWLFQKLFKQFPSSLLLFQCWLGINSQELQTSCPNLFVDYNIFIWITRVRQHVINVLLMLLSSILLTCTDKYTGNSAVQIWSTLFLWVHPSIIPALLWFCNMGINYKVTKSTVQMFSLSHTHHTHWKMHRQSLKNTDWLINWLL